MGAFARSSNKGKLRSKARAFGMCCFGEGSAMKLESDVGVKGCVVHGFIEALLDDIEKGVN